MGSTAIGGTFRSKSYGASLARFPAMRISFIASLVATAALSFAACGGYTSPSSSTSPSPTTSSAPAGPVTVNITGSAGSGAYAPNPVDAAVGSAVVFMNNNSTSHHIVLDDGSGDFGTISPGQTSAAVTVSRSGPIGFHCVMHPSMVGTINGSAASTAPAPAPGY